MKLINDSSISEEEELGWIISNQLLKHFDLSDDMRDEGVIRNTCNVLRILKENPQLRGLAVEL